MVVLIMYKNIFLHHTRAITGSYKQWEWIIDIDYIDIDYEMVSSSP